MKRVLAVILSLAVAFPAVGVLAQQAPAKVQPVQVSAAGGMEGAGLAGMSMGATIAVVAAIVVVAVASNSNDDAVPVTTAASGTF